MMERINRRGHKEYLFVSHLKLSDLKEKAKGLENKYLCKNNIPPYPRPEFHVSHLKHDTNRDGLRGICRDSGFKNPFDSSLVWWSLFVGPDEINSAERRLLKTICPNGADGQATMQRSFLGKFATSPAFVEPSRLGSYRFIFTLEEVLLAYSEQFCAGTPPMIRAFRTSLFKKEVMYVVLVHSPVNEKMFSDYPLLTDEPNSICGYRDGYVVWRPEAMCETHRYRLVERPGAQLVEAEEMAPPLKYYVWDHVGIALHVDDEVLNFDSNRLRKNLKFCSRAVPSVTKYDEFDDFQEAQEIVQQLWPDYPSALERCEEVQGESIRETTNTDLN